MILNDDTKMAPPMAPPQRSSLVTLAWRGHRGLGDVVAVSNGGLEMFSC